MENESPLHTLMRQLILTTFSLTKNYLKNVHVWYSKEDILVRVHV